MLNKDQSQDVGAGATAIQAGGDVFVGISASEARQIALDQARLTFYELTGAAKQTLDARVEEITDKVISRIEEEYPEGLKKAIDPDFQYALLSVQKNYGRSGDADLGDLLVDLLVDRSKQDERNIVQIVLNESLDVAPKLTESQLANTAMLFLFRYSKDTGVGSIQRFGEYLDEHVLPFVGKLSASNSAFQHLEFTGCGATQAGSSSLAQVILHAYTGLFFKGFKLDVVHEEQLSPVATSKFIIPCLHDSDKYQVGALDVEDLNRRFLEYQVDSLDMERLTRLFHLERMSHDEVKEICVKLRPYMDGIFACWDDSMMKRFSLTSVGIAIGHANVKRFLKRNFGDLNIWIN